MSTKRKVAARTHDNDNKKIRLLVKENPKHATAAKRFSYYKNGLPVSAYVKKVGDRSLAMKDIYWDRKQKWIRLV